jgi:hypothetical protein
MSDKRKSVIFKDIPKKDPFKAPKGYFESFPEKIQQSRQREKERELNFNWKIIKYASAASVAILITFLIGYRNIPDRKTPEALLMEVSTADLLAYLELTEVELFDLPGSTNQELEDLPLMDSVNIIEEPDINEKDFMLFYERYGLTIDDNIMIF